MAGQQHDETVAQQDVTSRETVVAEVVTKSRNKRDTANVALRATTQSISDMQRHWCGLAKPGAFEVIVEDNNSSALKGTGGGLTKRPARRPVQSQKRRQGTSRRYPLTQHNITQCNNIGRELSQDSSEMPLGRGRRENQSTVRERAMCLSTDESG